MREGWARLRSIVLRNKGAKLAAVAMAVVTWYWIQTVIRFEEQVTQVPIRWLVDNGWAVLDPSSATVNVLFRGSQEDIRGLHRNAVKVEVDLRNQALNEGARITVRLRPKNVRAQSPARPIAIQPDLIELTLDRHAQKQVPVKAEWQGAPPEDYEVERWVSTPATVTVSGPERRLRAIEFVSTVPIDLEGRTKSFRKRDAALRPPLESGLASLSTNAVTVEVVLTERNITLEWTEVPVHMLMAPGLRARGEIWPPRVTVSLRGRTDAIKSLQKDEIRAFVDCSALEKGAAYDLPVRVDLPAGLTLLKVEPRAVKVTLSEL